MALPLAIYSSLQVFLPSRIMLSRIIIARPRRLEVGIVLPRAENTFIAVIKTGIMKSVKRKCISF